MPTLEQFLLFLAADLVLKLSPGPDMAAVIARGITQGHRAGIACAMGVGAAGIIQVPAAAFGLGAVFAASPVLYESVKLVGVFYLVWIGVKALRRCWMGDVSLGQANIENAAFKQGFITNLLNPKIYIFLIAFIPQFVSPETGSVWLQTLVLVTVMKLKGTALLSVIGWGASRVRGWVAQHSWFLRAQNGLLGSVMLALAGYVAFGPDPRSAR
ncbi:LysE family translocator [Marivita sp. GX14005]|uniref:LysE family translocator n=1 Tax=Marivita sp. GX14005 TaxID=2942276 RepID=UPI002018D4BA|nr:LysE family translocator [Marivita sp. GX14005]MCL3882802.1 LysE family translocator [Marivita sp. GX14005]